MILLKLILFAQSFGFQSPVTRIPYVVNSLTGSTFFETQTEGRYHFELCELTTDISNLLEDINKQTLPCRTLTPELQFANEADHQKFNNQFAHDLIARLKDTNWQIRKEKYMFGFLTLQNALIFNGFIRSMNFPSQYGSILKVGTSFLMLLGLVVIYKDLPFDLGNVKQAKLKQLVKTLENNNVKQIIVFVDDSHLLDLYEISAKVVSVRFLKHKLSFVPAI